MTKTTGNLWYAGVLAMVLGAGAAAGAAELKGDANADRPAESSKVVRHDQPGEAAEFYLRKRLAPGMTSIPVEQLLQGYEQMKSMTQYSSSTGQRYDNQSDAALRAPNAVLAAWSELGPGNVGGRTRAIVIDPVTPAIMYAGGVGGGVWKTTDGGANWAPVSDTMANIAVVSLAMDPTNPAVLYAGTGEGSFNIDALRGAGIFKSTDSGATWSQLASTTGSNFHYVNDLIVAPSNNQLVVAATGTGIFTSSNGGASFTQTSTEIRCLDLSVTTISGTDTWLAGCGNFSQGKVLRSTNATTWTQTLGTDPLDLNAMGRTAVAIRGNRAYAVSSSLVAGFDRNGGGGGDYSNQLHAFFRSDDGGQTWTATVRNNDAHWGNTMILSGYFSCSNLNFFTGQGWYDIAVSIDPADPDYVWVGGVHLFRSADGGLNWGRGDNIHPDHHLIVFHPQYDGTSNQIMFNGQDGGIYRTVNARAAVAMLPATNGSNCTPTSPAVSWTTRNNNYAVTQFYHGTAYPNGTSYFAGAQDNGVVRGTDGTGANAWSYLTCGDGGYTAVNPGNTNEAYASCQNVDIRKTTTGNPPFNSVTTGISSGEGSIFIPPFAMDPNNSQRLWFGGIRAWRTDNAAANWSAASASFNAGNDKVTAIAVAPGNSDLVLMAGNSGSSRIHRTTAATTATSATSWTSTAVSGYVAALTFAPSNNNIAYAAISTYGQPHVLKSSDGGATWTNASGSGGGALPDVPALGVVVHPDDANRVYVGTDIGVFVTLDGGANWAAEITSFPNVSTESLQIIGSGNSAQLFAFTHGRGAFKLSLASGPGTLGFAQASQTVIEGATAQIQVNRTGGSDGAVSVTYQTNDGTAVAPGDYVATSGTLNWSAGDAASKTINVVTNTDGTAEPNETFTVTLGTPIGGATLGTSTHTVTIADQGVFPPACIFPAGYSTSSGSQPWVVATDSVQEGACSLKSNNAGQDSTNARIETTNTFEAGNVTFYARVSSEAGWDCLRFLIDGARQNIGSTCNNSTNPGVSGDVGWALYTVPITAGTHTITWSYEKDDSQSVGSDAAWIDLVTLPLAGAGTAPVFTSAAPAGGSFGSAYSHTYTASGSPAPTFALQTGSFPPGVTLSGATLSGTPSQAGTFTGTVRASNTAGNVDQAFSITIAAVVPGAPTLTTLTPGDTTASAVFSAPASNGGAAIIDYTVSCTPGPVTATNATSPVTVTGLSNGTTYSCSVRARNSAGSGAASNALSVTPGVAPVFISAAPAGGTFGSPYTHNYTASGSPAPTFALQTGSFPPGVTLSGATLSGTPTQAGTFTGSVRASNTAGNVDQAFSITIAAVVPGAPTLVTLTPGDTTAQASFTAPGSNGGAAIIDYTVSCTPGPVTTTNATSPITVTGLSNGTTYSCSVRARNTVGSGPASNALGVTPAATTVAPVFISAPPAGGSFGAAYSHTFTASGVPAPTFALQSGNFPGGVTLSGAVLSGTPNQAGTFTGTVRASNPAGFVDQSFSIVIAAVVPGAPTLSSMAAGNASASAQFTAPASNGGAAILDYTVTCTPGPVSATGAASPILVSGLNNGTTYSCTVAARNSAGTGASSNALDVTPVMPVDEIFGNGFE